MKRKLLGILTGVFLLLISVQTASATSDYTVSGGQISVSADGVVTSSSTAVTEVVIPEKVGNVTVTAIGKNAFKSRSKLTRVVIPDSVQTVGEDAFNSCGALEDVTLPAGVALDTNAFAWCRSVNHVKFTGTGAMSDFTDSYTWTPWYSGCYYNDHDLEIEIQSGVTSIGAHTFHSCGRLTVATVPDTVKTIGASAFESCGKLADLSFVEYADEIGAYAFKNCGATGAVTVKDGVTEIPAGAFQNATLQTLTLPNSVKTVGVDAFNGCSSLETVTLPAAVTLDSNAFAWCRGVSNVTITGTGGTLMSDFTDSYTWTPWYSGCYYNDHPLELEIQSGVASIGAHAFHGCGQLTVATIADSVKKIGESAFEDCSSLGSLYFVEYADEIGAYAFKNCGATGAVTVKDGVTEIPAGAFYSASSLQTLTLPNSVKTVGADAFNSCAALANVTVPADMALDNNAFAWCRGVSDVTITGTGNTLMSDFVDSYTYTPWYSGCYYNDHDVVVTITPGVTSIGAHTFHGCGSLTKATVADSVKKIGESAFEGCSKLESLSFVQYVDEIGAYAFKGCSGATGAVTVRDGVTEIPAGAFHGASSLQTLTLPNSVKTVGADAFNSCTALANVTVPADMVLDNNAFAWCRGVSNVTITGTGKTLMSDFTDSYTWTPWYSGCYYNDHPLELEIQSGVTSIGAHTFHGCGQLTVATVANTVKKIGASAFESCGKLESLSFVQYADEIGAYAFKGCSGATGAVTVRDGVASIPAGAFHGASSLETLTLPESLKTVGEDAFNSCSALANVTIPAGVTLDNNAFAWCRGVSHVLFIGKGEMSDFTNSYVWTPWYSGCYYNDHDLTIEIQSGVTSIGAHTFHSCGRLTVATVAESVKKIGASAFESCGKLESISFARYADEIGEYAFKNCGGATGGVAIKDGVTAVSKGAFYGCSSLQTLTLPDSVQTVGEDAFNSCTKLADVTLPANVTLDNNAFAWCRGVSHVTFTGTGEMSDFTDSYVWTPWYSGCYYNDHDVSIDIAPGVKSIGKSAFRSCGRVQSITVPLSVTRIDYAALHDCSTLHVYYAGTESQWGSVAKPTNTGASGNTKLYMHYASAAKLTVTAPDGRTVLSQEFTAPENAIVFVVGYDSAGKMTETQSKTGAAAVSFAVSDTRTAKVRVLTFGTDYAPLLAPLEAAV